MSVEFALTAPILFTLVFGAIEFSRANMLLHTASIAATEGARKGIVGGASATKVEDAVRKELAMVGITDASVAIAPSTIAKSTQVITVGVAVPVNATNGYLTPRFFLGKTLIEVTSMTREAKASDQQAAKMLSQEASVRTQLGG